MSKIYLEALTDPQKKVFPQLEKFAKLGNLVGGTALTLQLSHRRSYDFDIFLPKPLPKSLPVKVRNVFGHISIIRDTFEEFTFTTSSGLKITFFEYPFKNLYPFIDTGSIKIADWQDIALDKAHTIGRRAEYRDYVDLFFILSEKKISLDFLIQNAGRKFGDLFAEKLFLQQLVYFDDIDIVPVEYLDKKYQPEEIKAFFKKLTEDYIKEKLSD